MKKYTYYTHLINLKLNEGEECKVDKNFGSIRVPLLEISFHFHLKQGAEVEQISLLRHRYGDIDHVIEPKVTYEEPANLPLDVAHNHSRQEPNKAL